MFFYGGGCCCLGPVEKKNNPLNKLNHWPDLVPQGTDCKGHGLHQVLKVKKHWTAVAGGVCSCSCPFSPPTRPGRSHTEQELQSRQFLRNSSATNAQRVAWICFTPLWDVFVHKSLCGRRHLRVTTDPSSRIAANAQRVAWICFTPLWDVFVHRLLPVDEDISESRRIHLPESQQMHNVWLESASHPSETCLCTGCCLWTKTSQSHDGSIFQNRSKCTTCGLNLLHTPLRRVCAQAVACGRRHLRVTTDPSSRIAANAQRVAWICFTPLWDVFVHRLLPVDEDISESPPSKSALKGFSPPKT